MLAVDGKTATEAGVRGGGMDPPYMAKSERAAPNNSLNQTGKDRQVKQENGRRWKKKSKRLT